MEQIPSNEPIMDREPTGPATWVQIWIKAVTKPNEATFVEITNDPNATTSTAFTWAALAGFLSGIILGIVYGGTSALGGNSETGVMLSMICGFPIAGAIAAPISLAIGAGLIQWIAKLFGGTGSFNKLVYGFAAVLVPLSVLSAIISAFGLIPYVGLCIGLFSYVVMFYQIYLQIVAVKAVNQLGWGQAAGSVLIPGFVIVILGVCLVFGSLMVMGPIIGDTFDQINQSLNTIP